MSEIRTLSAHADTIYSLIKRQAGSLAKAIGETVMNSVDAFATRVEITLGQTELTVIDNGIGFKSKDQITTWFEELGFFHEEGNHRVFGKFGLGRAQLWAYGDSRWTTNEFSMYIDVKANGLDYELEEYLASQHKGVKIESTFYSVLPAKDLERTVNELKALLAYVAVPVVLNGERISRNPAKMKGWTHETERLWILVGADAKAVSSHVTVYNQGVRVCDMYMGRMPTALVISKPGHQFQQDMSRNGIDAGCPLWAEARALLSKYILTTKSAAAKKPVVPKSQRQAEAAAVQEAFEGHPAPATAKALIEQESVRVHFVGGPAQALGSALKRLSYRGRRETYVLGEASDERAVALHRAGVFRVLDRQKTDTEMLGRLQSFLKSTDPDYHRSGLPYYAHGFAKWHQDFANLPDVGEMPEYGWSVNYLNVDKLPAPLSKVIWGLAKAVNVLSRTEQAIHVVDVAEWQPWRSPTQLFVPLQALQSMTTSRARAAVVAASVLQLCELRANSRDLPLGPVEFAALERMWAKARFVSEVNNVVALANPGAHSAKALRAMLVSEPRPAMARLAA